MTVHADWPRLRSTLDRAKAAWRDIPISALGNFDQLLAGVRDKLDEFGLSLADPDVVYSGIVFACLFNALGDFCVGENIITTDSAEELGQVAALLTLLMAEAAPEEARR